MIYGTRFIDSLISIVAIIFCLGLIYWLFRRKFTTKREISKFRSRMVYLGIFLFLTVIIHIWINGFTQLLPMLSLIGTGLVISNKESLMNLVGWLIINWRGVFSEGDLVQIQDVVGYIHDIRLFYFKVYETTSLTSYQATGKTIKVPNSWVITSAITLFTSGKNLCLKQVCVPIKNGGQLIKKVAQAETIIVDLLSQKYGQELTNKITAVRKKNTSLASLINLKPKVFITMLNGKDDVAKMHIDFYCYPQDGDILEEQLTYRLISH